VSDKDSLQRMIDKLKPFFHSNLTDQDQQDLRYLLECWQSDSLHPPITKVNLTEKEHVENAFGEWLQKQLVQMETDEDEKSLTSFQLIEPYRSHLPVTEWMIGIFIRSQHQDMRSVLENYFSDPFVLFPFSADEYCLLIPHHLPVPGQIAWSKKELMDVATGLLTMLEEWYGGVKVVISEPFRPYSDLLINLSQLRLTLQSGVRFAPADQVYFSWKYELENKLAYITNRQRHDWLGGDLKAVTHLDEESKLTLMQYFKHQCNLNDTARSLHIHRNTLIYRLDRIRHETGRDVRQFQDALMVRISLIVSGYLDETAQ
jgi:carbohydrate diacid regulator